MPTPPRRLSRAVERSATVLRLLREAHARHGAPRAWLLARFLDVFVRREYSLREIVKLDLLDPARTRAWLDATASKHALYRVQRRLNPPPYWALTEDKHVFDRYCVASGLPVPRSFGCLALARGAQASDSTVRARALEVLANAASPDLVVKPAHGVHGRDVVALARDGSRFVDEQGTARGADEVLAWLAALSEDDAFVVQERLYGHPDLHALSGTRSLQTVRMVTYVRRDGTPMVGGCQLKIVADDALVDNFAHGARGNMLADVPRAAGVLSRAFVAEPDGRSRFVDRHPRTGVAFEGFRIPCWDEARALAERAALAFLPLRTVGWDVGITRDGALLVEGNASWDPPQRGGEVNGEVLAVMRDDGEWP